MGIVGYSSIDRSPTLQQLQSLVAQGPVRRGTVCRAQRGFRCSGHPGVMHDTAPIGELLSRRAIAAPASAPAREMSLLLQPQRPPAGHRNDRGGDGTTRHLGSRPPTPTRIAEPPAPPAPPSGGGRGWGRGGGGGGGGGGGQGDGEPTPDGPIGPSRRTVVLLVGLAALVVVRGVLAVGDAPPPAAGPNGTGGAGSAASIHTPVEPLAPGGLSGSPGPKPPATGPPLDAR